MSDSLGIDDNVMLLAALAVLDNAADKLLLIAVISLRKQNVLRSVCKTAPEAMYPALRPITSMMLQRSWDVDVSRTRSMASMAVFTAVSKPMV